MPVTINLQQAEAALDLDARLRAAPTSARVRGVWFTMMVEAVERRGRASLVAFRNAGGGASRWAFLLYDARAYLSEAVLAATLLNPESPREGLRALWRSAVRYSNLLHPGSFQRLLDGNPMPALRWLVHHRDHFATYGAWRLEERGPAHAVVHMDDELIWIDSAHRGGAEGLLHATGVKGIVHAELRTPYCGQLHLHWERRSAGRSKR